jgi:signal transduction histidine kinase
VKYAAGGTIQIRLGLSDKNKAILAVHDEGPGLDKSQLTRIFAPFEQNWRRSAGLGLGLHVARQIAQIHGRSLWAESRGRMNGSTFVLSLPLDGV